MIRQLSKNNKLQTFFLILAILVPLVLSLVLILTTNLTFWYDNTRDLLSAWDNLTKFTLIGPQSGVPGIFYGPYWIWLLSFGLLFSKNPLIVTIITATIPYFIIFPFVWFRGLNKFFDRTSLIIGWLLFMFGSGMTYATQLWNVYPAPLITLVIIYLFAIANFTQITKKQIIIALSIGFLTGLLINFDISFGLVFLTGSAIFLILDTVMAFWENKKMIKNVILNKFYFILLIITGLFISFLPTLFFELRHGFYLTQTLLHTFSKYGAVVTVTGLNKQQIIETFFKTFGSLLHLPVLLAGIILFLIIFSYCYLLYKKKIHLQKSDSRILLLIGSLIAGVLFIFLTAKNPVWEYHFIGVDVIFILFLTFFASKLSLFKKGLLIYTLIIVCISVASFIYYFHRHTSHYEQQLDVVKIITQDTKNKDYTVFAYNPSIYAYDFSYLFRWMAHKNVPYDPGLIKQSGNTIYLITPMQTDARVQDFIHFRSQPKKYKRVNQWKTETDYRVLKYIRR